VRAPGYAIGRSQPLTGSARPRPDRRSSRRPSSTARSRWRSNSADIGSDRVRIPLRPQFSTGPPARL